MVTDRPLGGLPAVSGRIASHVWFGAVTYLVPSNGRFLATPTGRRWSFGQARTGQNGLYPSNDALATSNELIDHKRPWRDRTCGERSPCSLPRVDTALVAPMALLDEPSGVLVLAPGEETSVGTHHAPPWQPIASRKRAADRPGGSRSPSLGRDLAVGQHLPWLRGCYDGSNLARERGHVRGGAVVASRGKLTV